MKYDGLVLFSGGLDSVLAIKVLQDQGLRILGVHFTSPFFNASEQTKKWQEDLGVEIENIDISEDFIEMLSEGPEHGFGKNLNPCRDCKILMLKKLKSLMPEYEAEFLATGEVVGQRPMSQTLESMNLIEKKAGIEGILLRPLSAKNLPETEVEKKGLVNREELFGLSGRSRTKQLELARGYGIKEEDIPSPAGGCLLTQQELSKRYGKILKEFEEPDPDKFKKANVGRHFWKEDNWLIVGRDKEENERLIELKQDGDILIKMKEPVGPVAIVANTNKGEVPEEIIQEAASFCAYFAPRARETGNAKLQIEKEGETRELETQPISPEEKGWQKPQIND